MNLSDTAKIMIASAAVICLIFLGAGLIVINAFEAVAGIEQSLPYAAGLALGGVCSVIKIILLEKSINMTLDAEKKSKAAPFGSLLFMARFLLTVGILVIAFVFPHIFGRIGVVLGILSMQFSAYSTNFFLKKQKPDNFDNLNDLSAEDEEGEEGEDGGKDF